MKWELKFNLQKVPDVFTKFKTATDQLEGAVTVTCANKYYWIENPEFGELLENFSNTSKLTYDDERLILEISLPDVGLETKDKISQFPLSFWKSPSGKAISSVDFVTKKKKVDVRYGIYAKPELVELKKNGANISDYISVPSNDDIYCTIEGKPCVKMDWNPQYTERKIYCGKQNLLEDLGTFTIEEDDIYGTIDITLSHHDIDTNFDSFLEICRLAQKFTI